MIRLGYLINQASLDFFWGATDGHMWSIVELNTALISGKQASLRPLFYSPLRVALPLIY